MAQATLPASSLEGSSISSWSIVVSTVILGLAILHALLNKRNPTRTRKTKQNDIILQCPISKESSFVVETAEEMLEPSPMDQFEDWQDHLGLRWLAAGRSGQDQPGFLRAQLKRFRHHQHFLLEDHLLQQELDLKAKLLDENPDTMFVMEQDSLEAQRETLELFLAYLPQRYPNLYTYCNDHHSTITVHTNPPRSFSVADWWDTRPLELCARIVQEDLILMRHSPSTKTYNMAAAAVAFSFTELKEKLGQDTNFIHAPVPQFQQHLSKALYMSFQSLKVEKPHWRNNWTIVPNGRLDEPSDAFTHQQELDALAVQTARDRYLKVEYQTIRRLPRNSQYLVFTVRTFTDPMAALSEWRRTPQMIKAASTLASSIRGMNLTMLKYKGVESQDVKDEILGYLDSIATANRGDG